MLEYVSSKQVSNPAQLDKLEALTIKTLLNKNTLSLLNVAALVQLEGVLKKSTVLISDMLTSNGEHSQIDYVQTLIII